MKKLRERVRGGPAAAGAAAAAPPPAPKDDGKDDDKSERWYPGKKVREKLAARRRRLRAARAVSAVGHVSVSALAVRDCCEAHPFVIVSVEGGEQATDGGGDGGAGSWNETSLSFPVADVTGDVGLLVMNAGPVRDRTVGRASVPLVSLLDAGPAGREVWLELLPVGKTSSGDGAVCPKFEAAAPGLPGSGMARPAHCLGFVKARLVLSLSVSVYQAYALSPPQAVPLFVEPEFNPEHMKTNALRLQHAAGLPVWLCAVVRLPTPAFALALLGYCWAAWRAQLHHLPLLGAAVLIGGGFLARSSPPLPPITLWDADIERDPGLPKSPLGKIKKLKGLIFGLQCATGALATTLEFVPNLYNWRDPRVTQLAVAATSAAALALSIVLYVVPLRLLCAAPGLALLLALHKRHRSAPRGASMSRFEGGEIEERQPEREEAEAESEEEPEPEEPEAQPPTEPTRLQMAKNVLLRVPTYHELVHREISAQAVRAAPGEVKFAGRPGKM